MGELEVLEHLLRLNIGDVDGVHAHALHPEDGGFRVGTEVGLPLGGLDLAVEQSLFAAAAYLGEIVPGVEPETHAAGGIGAGIGHIFPEPVGDAVFDAVGVVGPGRDDVPGAEQVVVGGPEGGADEDNGHAVPDDLRAIPHPLQEVHDRHDVDHVEFGQEAGGLAGDAEIEIEVAQDVEREEDYGAGEEDFPGAGGIGAGEFVGGDGEGDGHGDGDPDGPGGAVFGNVLHVFRGDLEVGGHEPEGGEPISEDGDDGGGKQDALILPGDPETPDKHRVEGGEGGSAIEIVGGHAGGEDGGGGDGPGTGLLQRQPGEGEGNGDQRQRAHVRAFPILDEHPEALRMQQPGVAAEARHEKEDGRHQRGGYGGQPGAAARAGSDAHQEVDSGDADGVQEGGVEMVGFHRPEAGEFGNGRGAVAQGGRINVVEARAGVPERLPLGMGPVVGEKARVGNEGAFNGGPFVGVLGFEVGADQHHREEKHQEEIQQDLLRARELGKTGQFSLPAACKVLLWSR